MSPEKQHRQAKEFKRGPFLNSLVKPFTTESKDSRITRLQTKQLHVADKTVLQNDLPLQGYKTWRADNYTWHKNLSLWMNTANGVCGGGERNSDMRASLYWISASFTQFTKMF